MGWTQTGSRQCRTNYSLERPNTRMRNIFVAMNMYNPPHAPISSCNPCRSHTFDSWPGQHTDGNYTPSISNSRGLKCMCVCGVRTSTRLAYHLQRPWGFHLGGPTKPVELTQGQFTLNPSIFLYSWLSKATMIDVKCYRKGRVGCHTSFTAFQTPSMKTKYPFSQWL